MKYTRAFPKRLLAIFPYLILNNSTFSKRLQSSTVIDEIDSGSYSDDMSKFMREYYFSPVSNRQNVTLFAGFNSKELAEEISKELHSSLGKLSIKHKHYAESHLELLESVNSKVVVYLQSLSSPTNDNLADLMFVVPLLKRNCAKKIILVVPYFAYCKKLSRDEVSDHPTDISTIIKVLEGLGADQIISVNLGNQHLMGFSNKIPIIDLDLTALGATYFVEKLLAGKMLKNPIVVSPHVSSVPRAYKMQEILNQHGFEAG